MQELTLNAPVLLPAFTPDCRRLAAAGHDGQVLLWDVASGQRLMTLPGFGGPITSMSFSPDGQRLAIGTQEGDKGAVHIFDASPAR